ncbi:hypothetical protein CI109_100269 [Kwoniella shandongensis]|uniref:Signal recognition particle subunit SRP72 n=1 Tax=Kwoniella shandongensis TaxID=1734106 RepID=A0A5M6C4A4_9TREE|nr:uncharacterized protein CI109_001886 [Kwoniella shandongensis]KAA5529946.1 hypothetical protein CI109_001886 [Kwoniella shandongensis]
MSTAKATTATTKRKVFVARPPRSAEERLPQLYRALTDQVDDGYFQNAIKTSKKILALDPSSQAAFQTLLFLYLQTDEYSAALALLDAPPSSTSSLDFERAYCLYRLHREKEALAVLEGLKDKDRKVDHLEAQIRYRLGEYQRAQEIYEDLLAGCDSSSPEHPDILTNLSATTSHIDFVSTSYRSHLVPSSTSTSTHSSTEAELESYVPSLPTGWSNVGGLAATVEKKTAAVKAPAEKRARTKPRHQLPKGVTVGKAFTEDSERWIPLRQRTSYIAAQNKKKGGKESMGTGFTQGSTSGGAAAQNSGGGGQGGGGKNKKGKKK